MDKCGSYGRENEKQKKKEKLWKQGNLWRERDAGVPSEEGCRPTRRERRGRENGRGQRAERRCDRLQIGTRWVRFPF